MTTAMKFAAGQRWASLDGEVRTIQFIRSAEISYVGADGDMRWTSIGRFTEWVEDAEAMVEGSDE